MKTISKLHYITQDVPGITHWRLAEDTCKAGISWIQLRLKNKTYEEAVSITKKTLAVCRAYECKLIINDYVAIASECKTDGVHLGKKDMDVLAARAILGDEMIIGGTANTIDDLRSLTNKGVDYIGLGPYRFTTTKENLSPVLGVEGYHEIMKQYILGKNTIPVVAIGGILPEDVAPVLATGIYGIAIASAIGLSMNMRHTVNEFMEQLKPI